MANKLSPDAIFQMFEHIKEELAEIKTQTTKTNGRVTELETYKNRSIGAGLIVSSILIPILLYLLYLHIK